jgi:imidazolonepropionase-like amidohydrolase
MSATSKKTLVVRNGTLIDGSGRPAARNDAIVIEGNRIKSVGALPGDVELDDRRTVEVIDAGGQWIMPGLIDAHCHVSYGYPAIKGEGKGRGTTRPEFSTLKSARSVQKVLRSGVTGISVPGGTWFTDVGVRDAIKLGLMEGPRMYDRHLRLHRGRRAVMGGHAGSFRRQALQYRGRDGDRGQTAKQTRRQLHQDGGQPLRRIADAGERGDRGRRGGGTPAQLARR